jgi:hypothetical protein
MEPADAERHGREGRMAERVGASKSDTLQNHDQVVGRLYQTPLSVAIRGNSGVGLPR